MSDDFLHEEGIFSRRLLVQLSYSGRELADLRLAGCSQARGSRVTAREHFGVSGSAVHSGDSAPTMFG
jgi:hypothetical protein